MANKPVRPDLLLYCLDRTPILCDYPPTIVGLGYFSRIRFANSLCCNSPHSSVSLNKV